MRIEQVKAGSPVLEDYTVSGAVVSFGELAVDCEVEEADSTVYIPIMRAAASGVLVQGPLAPDAGANIAEIIIPPRRYESVEELNSENEIVIVPHPLPLEMERVTLRLWPL
jgi:hypothetical protein